MSEMTGEQIRIFTVCMMYGAGAALWYDAFRTLRRGLHHRDLWVHIEDLLYTGSTMTGLFVLIHLLNRGKLRLYLFVGMAVGACIYRLLLHGFVSRIMEMILASALWAANILRRCIWNPGKKVFKYFVKILKNTERTVRMIKNRL